MPTIAMITIPRSLTLRGLSRTRRSWANTVQPIQQSASSQQRISFSNSVGWHQNLSCGSNQMRLFNAHTADEATMFMAGEARPCVWVRPRPETTLPGGVVNPPLGGGGVYFGVGGGGGANAKLWGGVGGVAATTPFV